MNAPRPPSDPRDPLASETIDEVAARWVMRSRDGLDATSVRALRDWRAADPRHDAAFTRLSAMSDALQRAHRTGATRAIAAELNLRTRRRRARRRVLAGAGLAAAMVGALFSWTQFHAPETPATPAAVVTTGAIRHLPDGSLVELNGKSEITVNYEPGFRRIELVRGEALFAVAKNHNRPFIVRAHGVEVRAVGTAFNVRLEAASVEVVVTEGKVTLGDAARQASLLANGPDGQPGVLVAGQRAVIDGTQPQAAQISRLTATDLAEQLAWRRPRIELAGVELGQAVARINEVNRVHVVLDDDAFARLRVSGTFFADDPETFARLIAKTFSLEMENRGTDTIALKPAAPDISPR